MSETEIKLSKLLKLVRNYFSDIEHVGKYIRELQLASQIILK